jgi:probable F420-dependent oxidoreductase
MAMKVGVMVPVAEGDVDAPGAPSWRTVRAFAQRAEALGFDSLWVADHLNPVLHATGRPGAIHESWTLLTALAASTERVELGTLVLATTFRNPALVAKMAVTVDEVSGGRLILGLGCGNIESETVAFGLPWEARVVRFEEALRVIVPLLRGETVTVEGRFVAARDAVLAPAPQRRIPILVAAKGRRMLRLTARWADAWNTAWFAMPDERFAERMADLDAALAEEGRDPASITRTAGMSSDGRHPDSVTGALRAFAERGIDHVIVGLQPRRTVAALEGLADGLERYRAASRTVRVGA